MAECLTSKADLKDFLRSIKSGDIIVKDGSARTKPESMDNFAITNSMMIKLFTKKHGKDADSMRQEIIDGESTNKKSLKDIARGGRKSNTRIWKKIKKLKNIDMDFVSLFNKVDVNGNPDVSGLEIIQLGLSFNHMIGSIKTEQDLMDKYNLSEAQREQIMPEGELAPAIAALGNMASIGREIAYTQGLVLSPKKKTKHSRKQAEFDVEQTYAQLGMKAVRELEKAGFVDIEYVGEKDSTGKIVNRRFHQTYSNKPFQKDSKVIDGVIVRINFDELTGQKSGSKRSSEMDFKLKKYLRGETTGDETTMIESSFPKLAANIHAAGLVHTLKIPSNLLLPGASRKENAPRNNDVKLDKSGTNTLNQKEDGALLVSAQMENMFDYIYDYMEKHELSFEDAAKALNPTGYKEMMGYNENYLSPEAVRDSDRGKSLSKTVPMADFFENYSDIKNMPLHMREEVKRNGRGHYTNTVLNPQTDKFFGRFVISIPEYTIPAYENNKPTEVFIHLVSAVADQSGLSVDQVMNWEAKGNKGLNDTLNLYEDVLASGDGKRMFNFVARGLKGSGLNGSPWEQLDTLSGILSIRNAVEGGSGELKGTFMPKPDGTASGAVIMSMQMAGKTTEKGSALFTALGLDSEGKGNDAYKFVSDGLAELLKNENQLEESELAETIRFFLDNKLYKNLRDISKDPSMTVMYSQGDPSAIATVGKAFTDKVYRGLINDPNNKILYNQIKKWIEKVDPEFAKRINSSKDLLSEENSSIVYNMIEKYMTDNVSKDLHQIVLKEFKNEFFADNLKKISKIFNQITNAYNKESQRTTMIPPLTYYNAVREYNIKKNGKFDPFNHDALPEAQKSKLLIGGIPLMKMFETVQDPDNNYTIYRNEILHEINAHVNIVHAIDFAILTEAFDRTFKQAGEKITPNDKKALLKALDLSKNGTVSVHDAISAHPVFSLAFQENYREAARDINAAYDINGQLAYTLSQMKGKNVAESDTITTETTADEELKKAELKKINIGSTKIFGFDENTVLPLKVGSKPSKDIKKIKKFQDQNDQEQASEERISKRVSTQEGQEAYDDIVDITADGKTWYAVDTETSGYANGKPVTEFEGYTGDVFPSEIISMTMQEMNGKNKVGKPKTVWFRTTRITKGANKAHKMDPKFVAEKWEKQKNSTNIKTNKAAMAEIMTTLDGAPMIAYNANFDMDSVNTTFDKFGDENNGYPNTEVHDAYPAAVHAAKRDGVNTIGENNTLKDMAERVGETWDANSAHESQYDVEKMVPVLQDIETPGSFKKSNTSPFIIKSAEKSAVKDAKPRGKADKANDMIIQGKENFSENDMAKVEKLVKNFIPKSKVIKDFFAGGGKILDLAYPSSQFEYDHDNGKIGIPFLKSGDIDLVKMAIEHEIIHQKASPIMQAEKGQVKAVDTIRNAIQNLSKYKDSLLKAAPDQFVHDRLKYFLDHDGSAGGIRNAENELIAVLGTEPDTARAFIAGVEKQNRGDASKIVLAARVIVNMIKRALGMKIGDDKYVDAKSVIKAVNKTIKTGEKLRKNSPKTAIKQDKKAGKLMNGNSAFIQKESLAASLDYVKNANPAKAITDPVSIFISSNNDFVADILWNKLGPEAESFIGKSAKFIDSWLRENSSGYESVRSLSIDVWKNPEMQAIKAYIVPSLIKNRKAAQELGRVWTESSQISMKITTTELSKVDNLMKGMTKKQVADTNTIFARTPLFALMEGKPYLRDIANGSITIDQAISDLETKVSSPHKTMAQDFANLYIDGNATGDNYNMKNLGIVKKKALNIKQLTALYSLKKVDGSQDLIRDIFKNKKELYDMLSERTRALESITETAYEETGSQPRYKGNMVLDYYDNPIQTVLVPKENLNKEEFSSELGWKTLMDPEDNHGHAVLWRTTEGTTYQEGFGTNISWGNSDLMMPKDFKPKNMNGLIKLESPAGKPVYKMIIPHNKKQDMGLIENPAHTIMRSYAHVRLIKETQSIRDYIIDNATGLRKKIETMDPEDINPIVEMIKDKDQDEPWFLDYGNEVTFDKLPDEIKNRYKVITPRLSNIKGFSKKIKLVRNDVAPWMVGYKRAMPFENSPQLKKAAEIVLQAISLLKIHMIIINPAKVAMDAISTTTLMMSNRVSPFFIAQGWKRNVPLVASYSKLRSQQVDLEIQSYGGSKDAKKELEIVNDKLRNHPLAGAMNANVMQSLSTDIITRDYDTITGLQRNIDKVFNAITHDNKGNKNAIHKAIMGFARYGINIDDLMQRFADTVGKKEEFSDMAEEFAIMGERIAKIKKDDDVAKYLSEYFGAPSSTLTKLGSLATMYPDMMSRIIYRQFLIANWANTLKPIYKNELANKKTTKTEFNSKMKRVQSIKSEADMNDEEVGLLNSMVSDFMPDYTYAPPMVLDAAGRFFVTPFVSFTARIQRIIFNLGQKNPATLAASVILAESIGYDPFSTPYHVIGANYVTKDEYFNNVFQDLLSLQTLFPTKALNLDIIR